jgi:hypothetical protein
MFLMPIQPPVQGINDRGVESTTHHHLAPRYKKEKSYTSVVSLPILPWLVIRRNLPFLTNFGTSDTQWS